MSKGRLEAFSDGVIAIIITIMVLELKVPQGADFSAVASSVPVLLAYVLSFVNVGIYWANHHHMLHATDRIDGRVLWANLLLLFWLSLVPFVIRWMDEAGYTAWPTAAKSAPVLIFPGLARIASMSTWSTPAAPLLDFTRCQASCRMSRRQTLS